MKYPEAFRRLNVDPHRPPSVTIAPTNGDEPVIMEAEHMDVCITTNEVEYKMLGSKFNDFTDVMVVNCSRKLHFVNSNK
jgi:hypothetical protein